MKTSHQIGLLLTFSSLFIFTGLQAQTVNETVGLNDTFIFSLFAIAIIILLAIINSQVNALKSMWENKGIWMGKEKESKKENHIKLTVLLGSLISGEQLFAQTTAQPLINMTGEMYAVLISLISMLLIIILVLRGLIQSFLHSVQPQSAESLDAVSSFAASLTDSVPVERENEIMLDHNYDGIKELDNNLPPWWKYGFYLTILFAVVYMIHYHLGNGPLMIEEYNAQVAEAEIQIEAYKANQVNQVDENNLVALSDDSRLASGKKVYIDNCKICHGEFGEGMVGPNFTDKFWKHGGGIQNIYKTIKVGVPDKGMISWESQLTPGQILEVSSYILTLQGTNPPNQKAPEGEEWMENQKVDTPVDTLTNEVTITSDTEIKI